MAPSSTPDLLAAAERLVRKRGLEALTMDSLAEAAGVSRATVYRQVGSREALLHKLAERSDIVVENYMVGQLAKYQLDYASLANEVMGVAVVGPERVTVERSTAQGRSFDASSLPLAASLLHK